jgi:hypothetical protein
VSCLLDSKESDDEEMTGAGDLGFFGSGGYVGFPFISFGERFEKFFSV